MNKRITLTLLLIALPFIGFSQASDLIISEYVEGSSFNKYIEIFNGTGSSVDLSDYQLQRFQNGASSVTAALDLTGSLADGQTIVIANAQAAVYNGTVIKDGVIDYNGDDAMALFKKSTSSFVDIFGDIGTDPGAAWTVNGITTQNKTLIRKPTVNAGITTNAAGFPSLGDEWIMKDQDDVSNLGLHEFNSAQHVGESDAVLDPAFTFQPLIGTFRYSDQTRLLSDGFDLMQFIIRDGGEDLTDQDELETIVSKAQVLVEGADQVSNLGLFMDGNLIASTSSVLTVNSFTFTSLSIPDNSSKTIIVKGLLKEKVTDHAQVLVTINKIEVETTGSGFIQHSSNLITTPNNAPYNAVDVQSEKVSFFNPNSNLVGFVGQPTAIKVLATDNFGNVDIDANGTEAILKTTSGGFGFTYVQNTKDTVNFENGYASWVVTYPLAESVGIEARTNYGVVTTRINFIIYNVDSESIAPGLLGNDLITVLRQDYQVKTSLGYNGARDRMFAFIDNDNGTVTGVYSGFKLTGVPQDQNTARSYVGNNNFNTEHTWPQSLFNENEPMKSDIHHLFPTRMEVNGARSNYSFGEIDDNQTTTWYRNDGSQSSIPSSDIIDEFSEYLQSSLFEPREDHKGNVARAVFYFWTVYGGRANVADDAAFFNGMKDVLLTWHRLDLPDQKEVKRSDSIAYYQGNKNPFVHDTSLVARAYFPDTIVSNENETLQPVSFDLQQNYPNPFNPSTTISFSIKSNTFVQLQVFNMIGKKVATLTDSYKTSGSYSYTFDASSLSSGVYMYRLNTTEGSITKAMMLIK